MNEPQGQILEGTLSEKGLFLARDRTSIYYEVQGEGKPLLFCYGLTCRRQHWRHQIRHLAHRYQIVTFDYRGHHASATPPNDRNLTIEWCARDIEDLMNHLGLEEAVCLGHSMGVPVLANAALLLERRMKGMVWVCGAVHNPFDYMFFTNRLNYLYRASAFLFEYFPDASAKLWRTFTAKNALSYFLTAQFGFNPETSEELDIVSYLEGVHRTPLEVFHRLLEDYTRFDGRELLPRIAAPTLIVAGEDDCITPVTVQREMAKRMPQGELAVIPHGSHNAHTDFPEDVNRRIDQFLDRLAYGDRA